MQTGFLIVVHTANILGITADPWEFDGDHGSTVNDVRKKVFELVVPEEAFVKHLTNHEVKLLMQNENATNDEIAEFRINLLSLAIEKDRNHGPTFAELVPTELIQEFFKKQKELNHEGFTEDELIKMVEFLTRHADKKVFRFLHNNPPGLLGLELPLLEKSAREGKVFLLPSLTSIEPLKGKNANELKKNLMDTLFTKEILSLTKNPDSLTKNLNKIDEKFRDEFFGTQGNVEEMSVFCGPGGQVFFYWLFQSLNLHLVSQEKGMIEQVNKVKELFAKTFGNQELKANALKEKLVKSNNQLLFTQEGDEFTRKTLIEDGLYLSVDKQNSHGGCYVFLNSKFWDSDYTIVPLDEYKNITELRMNIIKAKQKETGEEFLLASCHGDSLRAEDGRLKIQIVMEKFNELKQKNPKLQLIIGTDANTKSEKEVKALKSLLEENGLVGTSVGPTTVKRRMSTVQHSKAGRYAMDEEDFLITLAPEKGGHFTLSQITVGFSENKPDPLRTLPDLENLSDHYPVGATLIPIVKDSSK